MKYLVLGVMCVGLAAVAVADEGFSFDSASVRFGYADGYWDHEHRWHTWPHAAEARAVQRRFQDRIYGYRHTRYPNDGWRESGRPRKAGKAIDKDSDARG